MKQTREIKSFIFSQYFSDGLRITVGVLFPPLIFAQLGKLEIGLVVSLGALCVSLADNPGPVAHKRNGMLLCALLISLSAILTRLINTNPVWVGLEILLFCFFFSMFSIYGNRASSVGTAALLVMILTIDNNHSEITVWENAFYILAGGLWYFILSLSVTQIRPYRLSQQALGESIKEVAAYLRYKAAFYDVNTNYDENYKKLIDQQIIVHHHQDTVRELLFRNRMMVKEPTNMGRILILVFVDIIDLFEQTMATYYDYYKIRDTYGKTSALKEFNHIILKLADELDNLGYDIISNIKPNPVIDFKPELEKLKFAIDQVEQEHGLNNLLLKKILINIRNMVNRTDQIYSYFNPKHLSTKKIRSEIDLPQFVSHQPIDFQLLKNNLTLDSSIFRHSLRVALVCLAGYIVSKAFPLGHHSYWILLTILVILKPGFSLTKQRNLERLIGTLAGGIIGAGILIVIRDPTILFILLLIFMIGAYSFQRLNYIVSVVFMTPYILILFSFLGANNLNIAQERIIDTFIGCSIGLVASYFILPSWEYRQYKTTMREVLIANYYYLLKVAEGLAGKPRDITAYKLARKDVYVNTANIGGVFQRMLSEPKSKQKNIKEFHKFVVLNHILSSYIATLISILQQSENRMINPDHIKLVRKSLYALSESIHQFDRDASEDNFKEAEIPLRDKSQRMIIQNPDSELLTEQLELVNNITGDIQKVSEKLAI
ncbi:MAG: FUSC family membrane protein [Daejeonella sp.]